MECSLFGKLVGVGLVFLGSFNNTAEAQKHIDGNNTYQSFEIRTGQYIPQRPR